MFLNFYRKNLWFHNCFIILQQHRRFIETGVCNRSIFPVFFGGFWIKAKVYCSDFFVFVLFIIVFWCFQAFLWVSFAKYSDYCTRFLVGTDAFLCISLVLSFYLCNCLPFVRVYFADDVYVVIFASCRSRFCFWSGVYGCIILFFNLTSLARLCHFAWRTDIRAWCVAFFWYQSLSDLLCSLFRNRRKYRLKPHCLVCFTSNKLSTYQQCVFSIFRFENVFIDFFTAKRLTS